MEPLTGLFGALDVVLGFLAWRSHQHLRGLTRPVKVKRGKRNSIMLLGLGGVGKTAFVRNLFHDPGANPDVSTEHYELYQTTTIVRDSGRGDAKPKQGEKYTLFVGDYRGQNLGQLVREFVTQQKKPFEPMSYGFINSLILVVDLFPPPERIDDPARTERRCGFQQSQVAWQSVERYCVGCRIWSAHVWKPQIRLSVRQQVRPAHRIQHNRSPKACKETLQRLAVQTGTKSETCEGGLCINYRIG